MAAMLSALRKQARLHGPDRIFQTTSLRSHAAKTQFPVRGELGQHVNKVSTAELTHGPSGVTASDSRSQHTNRGLALLRLVEKLEAQRAIAVQERKAAAAAATAPSRKCSKTNAAAAKRSSCEKRFCDS